MSAVQDQLDEAHMVYLQFLLEAGCKFISRTYLFGKQYVWMKDNAGILFLERIPEQREASDA